MTLFFLSWRSFLKPIPFPRPCLQAAYVMIKPGSQPFCSVKEESHKSSVNPGEVEKFSALSLEWWAEHSQFAPLRYMNTLRVPFVRDGLLSSEAKPVLKSALPLQGYSILDVGCGGGLLSEPLARIGATVTGLDPSPDNIRVATDHISCDDVKGNLTYICSTVEDLCKDQKTYDAVVCSEVIEHVDNLDLFVKDCVKLVKNGGSLFFTTVNRTSLSYAAAIIAAEYVLQIVPKGTHEWSKFVKPEELEDILESVGCEILSVQGMVYNPLTSQWSWSFINAVNYALHAVKRKSD